ncbi:AfsR/SARP family transcriptional regulator [Nocardiopsis ansamitocini]|uniref:OmpR/PhoB-type domain-containing protein n=1 Tax=Nocardiopsis ansamitocini TaxID=1670832 RepID=A0A9W6UIH4_9ACTN|nr:BTAD domain-containing putative transcriptional regulator [Nocardiopsis ansamitocini]GLU47704.1 hypothetical protein Nans01_20550 [Nocardiopsis ansamitocini]
MTDLSFGVLGQLTVQSAGTPIRIQGRKRRALLAALLLRANRTVPVAELIVRMWGPEATEDAYRGALQVHVVRLRALLGRQGAAVPILNGANGYRIELTENQLDLLQCRALLAAARTARAAGDLPGESDALVRALLLWRGPILDDVAFAAPRATDEDRPVEELLGAAERCAEVELLLGRYERVASAMAPLLASFPHREVLVERVMTALYRVGRQSEALEVYERTRAVLADRQGIDPGPALQRVFHAILRGEPTVVPRQRGIHEPFPLSRAIPAQLPPDIAHFTGRRAHLSAVELLAADQGHGVLLSGRPGSGCSALAVRWAHLAATRFPDGQLYVDLRGAGGVPKAPGEVLSGLLRALGTDTPPSADIDEGSALLRSVLASRRLLMVMDNAWSADQVRPLLPGTGSCAVVVTSRFWLADLIVRDGLMALEVDALTEAEAWELLIEVLGMQRVVAEPDAVALLFEVTERLPLPLRIAAAWLVTHPDSGVGSVVRRVMERCVGDPVERMRGALGGDPRFLLGERP